jgi:hypothetical protein
MGRRLIAALVLAVVALSCSSSNQSTNTAITRGKTNAVVTIHVEKGIGIPDQEVVRLCARNGKVGPNYVPSAITWVADDPSATLDIVWSDSAQVCVRGKHCNGAVCQGMSNVGFHGNTPARCEYTIVINGTGTKDPGVEVENCCP